MLLFDHFLNLFNESAPWLFLGLFIAGLIKAYIPQNYLATHLGGKGFKTTIKAALIGAPLPLCSCGVVPAALGIHRSGASKNATVSFLVATPETGLDSMSITYALMGPFMTIIRPIAAICSAVLAGLLTGNSDNSPTQKTGKTDCCQKHEAPPCCEKTHEEKAVISPGFIAKFKRGIGFSFLDMFDDIAIWLLVGLLFAAIVQTFVPDYFLAQWGSSWMAFVLMAIIGIPMYICATASTPIAAGLLLSGVSPGAVLVFMLVGPATNIGTLVIIKNELGKRPLFAYLSGIVVCSFIFGAITNYFSNTLNMEILSRLEAHTQASNWLYTLSSLALAILCIISLTRKTKHFLT